MRNLTAGELLDQVIFTQKDSGLPISHIVLMGMGEPLDNYENVRRFLTLVNRPEGCTSACATSPCPPAAW